MSLNKLASVGEEMLDEDLEDLGSCFCEQSIGGEVTLWASCQYWCHPTCIGFSVSMVPQW